MVNIIPAAVCRRIIGEIGTASKQLQEDIHNVAVSCLAHVRDHGDTTLAVDLLKALPNGQRVKALAVWFSHFSNSKLTLRLDNESGEWVAKLDKQRTVADFDVEGAVVTNYADLTTEKDPQPLTVEKFLRMIEKVANDDKVLTTGERKVPAEVASLASSMLQLVKAKIAA